MHIPDGFLDAKTAVGTGVLSLAGLAFALREARRTLPPRKVPLLGLSAAFVFAAQMLNFPVAGGTSGHMVGGVLVAALLGPSAAVIVLASVLIVQCFMFADGGITALGANILNMGIMGAVVGWMIYSLLSRCISGLFGRIIAAVVAAWISTVLAAILCAGELAASGTVQWRLALPAMAGVHMLIGIGEGVITALVLVAIGTTRPELILQPATADEGDGQSYRAVLVFGFIAAMGLALFVSPFAWRTPDGLEKVAEALGLNAGQHAMPAPVADYKMPGVESGAWATGIAGGIGTVIVFGGAWLLARALVPKARAGSSGSTPRVGL